VLWNFNVPFAKIKMGEKRKCFLRGEENAKKEKEDSLRVEQES